MTRQEMREFAQSQVEWYTKQIEWEKEQIERINQRLAQTRKEDKEMIEWALERYPNDRFAQEIYKAGYKGQETRKLMNERSKHYRWIKKYQANIEHYKQEVIKYTDTKKEDQTMKSIFKGMTKNQAINEIATLSSSTLARICGSARYERIDDCCNKLILAASSMKEDAFAKCENWMDVLDVLAVSKDNDVDNYYLLGNMDFREYITKYGLNEANTIFKDYVECITRQGIQNTKTERDYTRGAKDALCIS